MSRLLSACVLLFLVEACASGLGKCPKHPYMQNFNMTRFAGKWFEVERSFYLMELMSSCATITLQDNPKGQLEVSVRTVGKWSGNLKHSDGIATISKRDPSVFIYKVNSKLPNALSRFLPGAGFYQVLDTDYEDYAILWTCSSVALLYTDMVWILGRRRDIDAEVRLKIYEFLAEKHIDSERLIASSNNCAI